MATTYDPEEYIAALGNLTPLMRDEIGGIEGITDINGQVNIDNLNNVINGYTQNQGYNMPINMQTDPTYSSGLNYAQSIAGGQNVPNMIAPGISYSAEQPGGYTQADLNGTPPPPPPVYKEPDDPSFFGTGIGGVRIHQDRKNIPFRNIFGNMSDVTGYQVPTEQPVQLPPQEFNIEQILQDITDSEIDIPNIKGPVDMPFPPIQQDQLFINDSPFIEQDIFTPRELVQGPVDMPIPTDIPESLIIPKVPDELFIDNMARFIDIPSEDYKVPQVPLNNLLNQNPPQTPVGMSPQELAKTSSQQELLNLISNKDELTQIPADDGVRNQYQVELDEFINKSPINMDTYKEELPVGSAINLGIPAFMESVVPMAVPGLGLAKNISDSFQNDFSPSGLQSFEPSPVPSFTPGIDYSQVRRFGR
jgi:hypothetical protein